MTSAYLSQPVRSEAEARRDLMRTDLLCLEQKNFLTEADWAEIRRLRAALAPPVPYEQRMLRSVFGTWP